MAEGLLFAVAELMIETLGSAAVKEIGLLWGVKDEFEKLQGRLRTIKSVLRDAEKQRSHNEQVKEWLERLEDVVTEADDLLDEVATEGLRRQVVMHGNRKIVEKVSTFFSSSNKFAFRHHMAHKIKHIRETLDEIVVDSEQFHLEVSREEALSMGRVRETHSFVVEEDVVGRVEDKEEVLKLLLRPQNRTQREKVSVLPIVGMGGLGKTTLAQLVFNDEQVKVHFDLKFWVCVSDNFDEKLLIEKIVKSISGADTNDQTMEKLHKTLKEKIGEKRYLIVLDDVWSENTQEWHGLKGLLNSCRDGSKIIVTTRSEVVSNITGTMKPFNLGTLDENKSWSLFRKIAFELGEEPTDPENLGIAREIVKKCGGVPLAITTIGGLLYSRGREIDWRSFLEREFSEIIPNEKNHVLKTLRLSYDYLPSHLKCCFAFCSLFPKDYRIEVSSLINMWIAQGFIKSSNKSQTDLEDIGYKYFTELYWRSFFQEVKEVGVNKVKVCKMHDLVHDLAVQVAGKKYSMVVSHDETISARVHHLSFNFYLDSQEKVPNSLLQEKRLRTIFFPVREIESEYFLSQKLSKEIFKAVVSNFKSLRMLDLHDLWFQTLPKSIGELKYLRYLDLSGNNLRTLPTSITKLVNLQTLKLNKSSELCELPREIEKLFNLRHLEFYNSEKITHFPKGLSQLTNLKTFSRLVLTEDPQSAKLDVLMRLNQLRGKLEIEGLRAGMETEGANLKGKENLQSLSLQWSHLRDYDDDYDASFVSSDEEWEKTLQGFHPHPNLRALKIFKYDGPKFSNWISSLKNLVALELINCLNCQILPSLDKLSYLKMMKLDGLSALEYIVTDDDGHSQSFVEKLPSLEQLILEDLPKFKGWRKIASGVDNQAEQELLFSYFPRLTKLTIKKCPKLTSSPMFPNIEELSLNNTCLKSFEQTMSMSSQPQVISASLPHSSTISIATPTLSKLRSVEMHSVLCDSVDLHSLPDWMKGLTSLPSLEISGLPEVRRLNPVIQHLTSLQELKIRQCEKLEILGDGGQIRWETFTSMHTLVLYGLPKLHHLFSGIKHLTSLQNLRIDSCDELETLSNSNDPITWGNLTNLRALVLSWLQKLKHLCPGIQDLTSLQHLEIENCDELELTPDNGDHPIKWENLTSLRSLHLMGLPKLAALPEGLRRAVSLQDLQLFVCDSLVEIPDWISELSSLQTLELLFCSKMESLPGSISRLTSLQALWIHGCPVLLERCQSKTGDHWHKIQHIPNLQLIEHDPSLEDEPN